MVFEYIAALPPGYDDRARMALTPSNQIVVTHPEHPPLLLQHNGQWVALSAAGAANEDLQLRA